MKRARWCLVVCLCFACKTPADPSPPRERAATTAAPVREEASEPQPDEAKTPAPPALLVALDDGLVRADRRDDEAAPIVRVVEMRDYGDAGTAITEKFIAQLPEWLTCYEAALASEPEREVRMTARWSTDTSGAPAVEVSGDRAPEAFLECVRAVALRSVSEVPAGSGGSYGVQFHANRGAAPNMREPMPTDRTAVREGGTCWVWEDYPCKPNKRCMADEWVPARCAHPAEREGVWLRWRTGQPDERGFGAVLGVELVGTGEVVWFDALTDEERVIAGARRTTTEPAPLDGGLLVEMAPTTILVADQVGVRVHDRRTGKRRAVFRPVNPSVIERQIWFDRGDVVVRGRAKCEHDAGQGRFTFVCKDLVVWFDGYTLAILARDHLRVLGTSTLDQAKVKKEKAAIDVRMRAGGYDVRITGNIFMQ